MLIFYYISDTALLVIEYPPPVLLAVGVFALIGLKAGFMPIIDVFAMWNIIEKLTFRRLPSVLIPHNQFTAQFPVHIFTLSLFFPILVPGHPLTASIPNVGSYGTIRPV